MQEVFRLEFMMLKTKNDHQPVLRLWNFSSKALTKVLSEAFPELVTVSPLRPSWRWPSSSWSFWKFCTSFKGREPITWSTELHLHSGWSVWCWGEPSNTGHSSLWMVLLWLQSDRGLWRSERLLYFWDEPLHPSVPQPTCFPFLQVQVTLENWDGSKYFERSSCTCGHRNISSCGLWEQVVSCEVAVGVWTGDEDETSWMTAWLEVFNCNLKPNLPGYIEEKKRDNSLNFVAVHLIKM